MRPWCVWISLVFAGASAVGCTSSNEEDGVPIQEGTEIVLDDGIVIGEVDGATRRFLGIPFAAPPVGELRWAPPEPPAPWAFPLDATDFSPACPQLATTNFPEESFEEDCLYLNVWAPDPAPPEPLPVMIWFHGGSNESGSTADNIPFVEPPTLFYNGRGLVEGANVVVVTVNYRLGVMGFFAHEALSAQSETGTSGNQGLLDQRLAMEWVARNIGAFGGDASNVTIFGESAGAFDVCFHMVSTGSRGLFHRAIGQSGGCTTFLRSRQTAEAEANVFTQELGCSTASDVLGCLRTVSVPELLDEAPVDGGLPNAPGGELYAGGTARWSFEPVLDGEVLAEQPRALFDIGAIADVPYLLGTNTDEGTLFHVLEPPVESEAQYRSALARAFGADDALRIAETYPVDAYDSPQDALERVTGDSRLVCSARDTAKRAAAAGLVVYAYNFDRPVSVPALQVLDLRATHGAEIAYVFGSAGPDLIGPEDLALSETMRRYWGRFAASGDPNGGGDAAWPRFTAEDDVRLNFNVTLSTVDDFRADVCELWESIYDAQFDVD